MRTIYTDKSGVYPWIMLLLSAGMFWEAFRKLSQRDYGHFGFALLCGGYCLFVAIKRFWDVRLAKREGRDHTIISIKDSGR